MKQIGRGRGERSSSIHQTSWSQICSHLSDSEIKHIGPKWRAEAKPVYLFPSHWDLNISVYPRVCVRDQQPEKHHLPNSSCYFHCGKDTEAKGCVSLFYISFLTRTYNTHTHTFHFNWMWSSSQSQLLVSSPRVVKTISESQVTASVWRFSMFSFLPRRQKVYNTEASHHFQCERKAFSSCLRWGSSSATTVPLGSACGVN